EAGAPTPGEPRSPPRVAAAEREAGKNLGAVGAAVAIVELGDAAMSERFAEMQEAPRPLRNHRGEERLALAAEVCSLRHVPQAIEVHVGAAVDRHDALAAPTLAREIFLQPRHRQCPCGLDDRAGVFEHILDGRADLVGRYQQDLIDLSMAEREGLLAD